MLIVANGTQFPPENENVASILEGIKTIETVNDLADKLDGQVIANSPSGGADSGKGIAKMIKGAMNAATKRNGAEIMVIVRIKRCEQESCLIFFSRFNLVESNVTYVSPSGDGNAPMNLAGQGYDPSNIAGILRDIPKAVKDAIANVLK